MRGIGAARASGAIAARQTAATDLKTAEPMKRLIAILAAAATLASCSVTLHGQHDGISVGAAVNISAQPPWGPAGYACAPYYYFPDFNIYYDVNRALFYYFDHGRWKSAHRLPPHAGPRDLYKFYKVVLDVRDPWLYNRSHRSKYKKYRGIHTQPVLRDTPGYRYRPAPTPPPAPTPYRDHRSNTNGMRNNYARPETGQGTRANTPVPQQRPRKEQKPKQQKHDSRANAGNASGTRSTGSRGR